MASIKNAHLTMGKSSSRQEYAEVRFFVDFSTAEVKQNLTFGLTIALYERDSALDTYITKPNGAFNFSIEHLSNGQQDDFIRWFDYKTIKPNGKNTRFFTIREVFDVGKQELGKEEYKALINVIPEISSGKSWTNEVSINLG